MPELPEVQTTVNGLNARIRGLTITDVWTDYNSAFHAGKNSIKNPTYFRHFKKEILDAKIIDITRRAKNILIHIKTNTRGAPKSHKTKKIILIHMKMTGHLMYGDYNKKDPLNRFIHFIMTFSNGKTLELSDMRKFANVKLTDENFIAIADIGPEPLDPAFTFNIFKKCLERKPKGKIKTVLLDQSIIAGIGNIYSDEALWRAGIHPEERVANIPDPLLKKLYMAVKNVLKKGIDLGGDSMSDYRNIDGERGKFQEQHRAYRKTGTHCTMHFTNKKWKADQCHGIILRKIVGGRSAHFCSMHQKFIKK